MMTESLPRVDASSLDTFEQEYERSGEPVILSGAVQKWDALHRWSPAYLRSKLGDRKLLVTINLPASGVPYTLSAVAHTARMSFHELMDRLEAGERAYLDQADIQELEVLRQDIDVQSLLRGRTATATNLWVGARTRSGLHFDFANNLLSQFWGTKHVVLAPPSASRDLHVFPDNPSKSQVDPDSPDLERFPNFKRARLYIGTLNPGDTLFIPRGWWHHLRADDFSVSLNTWYEETISAKERVMTLLRCGGYPTVIRAVRDLVVHGILKKQYVPRLFSPPPFGVQLYTLLTPERSSKSPVNSPPRD